MTRWKCMKGAVRKPSPITESRVSSFPFVYLHFLVEFDSHYARVERADEHNRIKVATNFDAASRCLLRPEMRRRDQKIRVTIEISR